MARCTIITPCFNDGAFLPFLRQSLEAGEPVRHIIVDDGSSDLETLAMLDDLARQPDITVIHQENGGPGTARNRAIAAVETPYALPVDADDIVFPGAIRDLADALDAHPELGVVWGDSVAFGSELTHHPRAIELDPWWFSWVNDVMVGLMGRTEVLAGAGWDVTSAYEDWGTTLALSRAGVSGRNIGRATYGYRFHGGERRLGSAAERDDAEIDNLRARYPEVFDARRDHRRASSAPRRVRALAAAIDRLPGLGHSQRHQLVARLSMYLWPRRWGHHPGELPRHPLSRRLLGGMPRATGTLHLGLRDVLGEVDHVVVMSPHFDDSALSAFALLDDPTVPSTIVNVFTVDQPGDWGRANGSADAARRAAEDEHAVGSRADRVDLEITSTIDDSELDARVANCLAPFAAQPGTLVVAVPAGAGLTEPAGRLDQVGPVSRLLGTWTSPQHAEHVRVAASVRRWAAGAAGDVHLIAYDEVPYHWARSGIESADPESIVHLPVDTTAKAAAVSAYESQVTSLFTTEQLAALPRWLPAVETFAIETPRSADANS